ncbi:hypothetical protein SAMN05414137_121162 [Streptacidiphilus jiangxiensis]|uniref:Uncharacterized protein n=1 Tax=Streptacidiphilus jiangxiensis TaxID=235985 RepID=A0A1H7WUW0_STRJI|nr:hypothetical protein SAMN05414137_121162 [Streptacidiphilus jiangxiensis]
MQASALPDTEGRPFGTDDQALDLRFYPYGRLRAMTMRWTWLVPS